MNNAKRKQEIREKVKEMKMRQQNWMKQKAEFESKSSNGNSSSPVQRSPDDVTTKKSKPVDNIERGVRSSSSNDRNNNSTERLLASHKSNAKFASWLKAKEVPAEDEGLSLENESTFIHKSEYNSNKYSDNYYKDVDYRDHKGSGGATTLRVPSERTSKVTSPEQGWDSEDETGEITAATLMSPEDFDSRADDIIAKVKGDLKLSTHPTSVYEEVRKSVSAVNNKMDSLDSQDSNLSSHESEITELQRQLQDLVTHKKDFERSYDELAIQARQEKNRLTMVHDSLTSVHQQIEKVKMLAGE
ncbi:hypothetical protein MAR_006413 [Mya arenaria]|uniref:Uncharacterized protein n=1 Tax=Mya arenaria TaxID=6604 RepID=A0ABY7D8F2_MYAAR|nr:hypothetical protein MAR_006413 [Mya arenaria]